MSEAKAKVAQKPQEAKAKKPAAPKKEGGAKKPAAPKKEGGKPAAPKKEVAKKAAAPKAKTERKPWVARKPLLRQPLKNRKDPLARRRKKVTKTRAPRYAFCEEKYK